MLWGKGPKDRNWDWTATSVLKTFCQTLQYYRVIQDAASENVGLSTWRTVGAMFTSFTIYSSSSKMAIGSGPSPVITSKLPGQPENTWLDQYAINPNWNSSSQMTLTMWNTPTCPFEVGYSSDFANAHFDSSFDVDCSPKRLTYLSRLFQFWQLPNVRSSHPTRKWQRARLPWAEGSGTFQ